MTHIDHIMICTSWKQLKEIGQNSTSLKFAGGVELANSVVTAKFETVRITHVSLN